MGLRFSTKPKTHMIMCHVFRTVRNDFIWNLRSRGNGSSLYDFRNDTSIHRQTNVNLTFFPCVQKCKPQFHLKLEKVYIFEFHSSFRDWYYHQWNQNFTWRCRHLLTAVLNGAIWNLHRNINERASYTFLSRTPIYCLLGVANDVAATGSLQYATA